MIFLAREWRDALASAKEVNFWLTGTGEEPPVKASGTLSCGMRKLRKMVAWLSRWAKVGRRWD